MKIDSIKKNYILNTIYQIFRIITPLITAPYVSRVFGPDGIGIRSYTNSIVGVFLIFASLGTAVYGQQTIAQCRDNDDERSRNFWEIEIVSIITTAVSVIIWIFFIAIYGEYQKYLLVLTIQLTSVAFDVSWYFMALEQFSSIVYRNIIITTITILLLFTLIHTKNDLLLYMFINCTGIFFCYASMWIPLRRTIKKIPIKTLRLKKHFKQTLIYFLPTIAASVYSQIDKVMIGAFTENKEENGYYEQAQAIINAAYTVVASLNTVMASRIAYLFSKNAIDEIKSKFEMASGIIMVLSIPLTFGIAGVSKNFVGWFFGDDYGKVALLMIIYSPLVVILSLHNFLAAQYLVPSGQRARSTIGVIIGAIVNLLFNLLLIPHFKSIGAVIGTLISEVSICIVYFYMSKQFITIKMILRKIYKPLFSSIVMFLIIYIFGKFTNANAFITIAQIIVGVIVYFFVMLLLKDEIVKYILRIIINKIQGFKKKDI